MKSAYFPLLAVTMVLAAIVAPATKSQASIYQTFNEGQPNAPSFWVPSSIGWYWTPATDVELAGIQTQLTSGFSNINNNFTFTTELFTDRPAAGGTSLGSFTWNGVTFVDGPWLGGSFSSPISLAAGVTYFIGMSGWENALGWNGPNTGAGVNWAADSNNNVIPGADHIGLLSSYGDTSGGPPHDFDTQWNGTNPAVPIATEFPFLRLIAADPDPGVVPELTSFVSFGLLLGLGAVGMAANARRRRQTQA